MHVSPTFEQYADAIGALTQSGPNDDDLERFLLDGDKRTRIYYAPFDWINTTAKIIVLGITPGHDSMMNAFRAATAALRKGASRHEALRAAKQAGSFSNMREKIARMLDGIGIHVALGLNSCAALFADRYDLLHPTSCIRYPVFAWDARKALWANYTGTNPKLLRWPKAKSYIDRLLVPELQSLDPALIVPCGEVVTATLRDLSQRKLVNETRCLFGFPHASGANGHCDAFYAARRAELTLRVHRWASSPVVAWT